MAVELPQDRRVGIRSLTPELEDSLCDQVSKGLPLSTAATLARIPSATLYEWIAIGRGNPNWADGTPASDVARAQCKALSEKLAVARAKFEADRIEAVRSAKTKWGTDEWRAHAFLLTHSPHTRANWYEERQVKIDHSGQVSHVHKQVREAPTEQLLSEVDGEFRELLEPLAIPAAPFNEAASPSTLDSDNPS